MPTIGSPSPAETSARIFGSPKCVVASTIARARCAGFARLEDPRADEHAVGAELHAERGVGGRCDPAGREGHDGQPPVLGDPAHELVRRPQLLRRGVQLLVAQRLQPADLAEDRAHVGDRVDDVARAGLALRADHRRALGDAPQRLAEVRRAADERDREGLLVDVVLRRRRASAPRTRRCSRPRAPRGSAPRRSGRSGTSPSRGSSPPPGSRGSSADRTCGRRRRRGGCRPARARAPSPRTAPASSAIRACSASTTSMITPPLSISARPLFTRSVPNSAMAAV